MKKIYLKNYASGVWPRRPGDLLLAIEPLVCVCVCVRGGVDSSPCSASISRARRVQTAPKVRSCSNFFSVCSRHSHPFILVDVKDWPMGCISKLIENARKSWKASRSWPVWERKDFLPCMTTTEKQQKGSCCWKTKAFSIQSTDNRTLPRLHVSKRNVYNNLQQARNTKRIWNESPLYFLKTKSEIKNLVALSLFTSDSKFRVRQQAVQITSWKFFLAIRFDQDNLQLCSDERTLGSLWHWWDWKSKVLFLAWEFQWSLLHQNQCCGQMVYLYVRWLIFLCQFLDSLQFWFWCHWLNLSGEIYTVLLSAAEQGNKICPELTSRYDI